VSKPILTTGDLHVLGKSDAYILADGERPPNILPNVWRYMRIVIDGTDQDSATIQIINTATGTVWASCPARRLEDMEFDVWRYLKQQISD
jgi:hypothetical protein